MAWDSETITATVASQSLLNIPAAAIEAHIQADLGNVRYRRDGRPPTLVSGQILVNQGILLLLPNSSDIADFRFTIEAGSPADTRVQVHYKLSDAELP